MMNKFLFCVVLFFSFGDSVFAVSNCNALPSASELSAALVQAPFLGGKEAGGLFHGAREWAVMVNRDGQPCAVVASTSDTSQVWPASQAIAKSKAYTANAFSLDGFAASTANLYTLTQPGHSFWSLGQSNQVEGGLTFVGGGVPLYKNGKIVGGLGISGDTSCADHEIAKRVRTLLGLDPPAGNAALVDDISYSSIDGGSWVSHPLCMNTWQNGVFIGNEIHPSSY